MGTNFYLKKRVSTEEKQKLLESVTCENYQEAFDTLSDMLHEVHIGKRSRGWKFLWNVHDFDYFKPTKKALLEWLTTGDIIDEYGESFTYEQFLNEELKGFIDDPDLIDGKEYYKRNPGVNNFVSKYLVEKYKQHHNIDVDKYGEFYLDNFRCTVYEDFC